MTYMDHIALFAWPIGHQSDYVWAVSDSLNHIVCAN